MIARKGQARPPLRVAKSIKVAIKYAVLAAAIWAAGLGSALMLLRSLSMLIDHMGR